MVVRNYRLIDNHQYLLLKLRIDIRVVKLCSVSASASCVEDPVFKPYGRVSRLKFFLGFRQPLQANAGTIP